MYWDEDFALNEYGGDDWSIWTQLSEVIDLWEQTYRRYWALDGRTYGDHLSAELAQHAASADKNAMVILRMVRSLTLGGAAQPGQSFSVSSDSLARIRNFLRDEGKLPVIFDRVSLELAKEYTAQVDGATERAFRLLGVLQGRTISDRSADYLRRVSALYIQGLELETGIMCRAALEAALLYRLEDQLDLDKRSPSLDALLKMAGQTGVLKEYQPWRNKRGWRARRGTPLARADRIRQTGNFILHDFLRFPDHDDAIKDAFECIRELSLVLIELFPDSE